MITEQLNLFADETTDKIKELAGHLISLFNKPDTCWKDSFVYSQEFCHPEHPHRLMLVISSSTANYREKAFMNYSAAMGKPTQDQIKLYRTLYSHAGFSKLVDKDKYIALRQSPDSFYFFIDKFESNADKILEIIKDDSVVHAGYWIQGDKRTDAVLDAIKKTEEKL